MNDNTINNVLCWEMVAGSERLVSRVFVVDRFVGTQVMHTQRSAWEIRDMGTPTDASNFVVRRMQELEKESEVTITVQPGTVSIYESEFNKLGAGVVIPPSLRIRIRQRVRRLGK